MFSEVILYFPHTKELKLEETLELYEENINGERKVDLVKRQVMEFLEDVTEARYFVEEALKDMDIQETGFALDSTFAQH